MIKVEKLTLKLIHELTPIIDENHSITGHFPELFIDWEMYLSLGDAFVAFILRDEGVLVGYLLYVVAPYPHNFNWLMGQQVSIFVKPDFRKFSNKLMIEAETHLKIVYGVELLIQSARIDTQFGKVLECNGFKQTDVTYTKRLT